MLMKQSMTARMIALFLLACLFLSGLTLIFGDDTKGAGILLPITYADETDDVLLKAYLSDELDCRPLIDGTASFEADPQHRVSAVYPADGTPLSLSLRDGYGLTWELMIPANALEYEQMISMTAMKDIRSDLGEISSGVILEPDGMRFIEPVVLSIQGLGKAGSGIAFFGDGTGDALECSIVRHGMDAVDMTLFHFSTAYASNSDEVIGKIAASSESSLKKLSALAGQLLKKPIEAPVPPAMSIACRHDSQTQDNETISKYIKAFEQPEGALISAMLSAQTTMAFATGSPTDYSVEQQLAARLLKKGSMLLRQYQGNEDMFMAVSSALLSVERQAALLGMPITGDQSFLPGLAAWAARIADRLLTELEQKHAYKNIHPILNMARSAALLGAQGMDRIMQRINDAFTFQMEAKNTITIGNEPSTFTYVVDTRAEIKLMNVSEAGLSSASGTGTYSSFTCPLLADTDIKMTLNELGSSFDVLVCVEGFLPCMYDTFTVLADRFGAGSETITVTMPDVPPALKEKPVVQQACEMSFSDKKRDGQYAFALTVRDGQKTAGEQTFSVDSQGLSIEYNIKLIHVQ